MNKKDILNKQLKEIEEQLKEIEKQERSDDFLDLLMTVLLDEKCHITLTGHNEWQFNERYPVKDITREYRAEIAKFLNTFMRKDKKNDK